MVPLVGWPPRCLLRALTGVPCPFCGMTTGVLALANGDVAAAFAANPAAPLLVVAASVTLAVRVAGARGDQAGRRTAASRLAPLRWPALAGMWVFQLHRFAIL